MSMRVQFNMEMVAKVYRPNLREYNNRINVFYGGANSGKSYYVVQKILLKSMTYSNRRVLVVRKVGTSVRESIFQMFLQMLSKWGLTDSCRIIHSRMEIVLPNKSTFIFKGYDDPEKVKSITGIDDIIVEEASNFFYGDFDELEMRLRSTKMPQMHLMFNPVSKANWVYPRWFAEGVEHHSGELIMHTTYEDNEFLDEGSINTLLNMRKNNFAKYQVYALGKFASLDKLVYQNYRVERFDPYEIMQSNPDIKGYMGLDFGWANDPTAFIALLHDKENKRIYIYDEFYGEGLSSSKIAAKIIEKGYQNNKIYADHDGRVLAEMAEAGVRKVTKAKKGAILPGVQYIQDHEIIADPRCYNFIEELQNFTWVKDKNTGEYINKTIDEYDHLMDAMRYALSEVDFGGKKVQSFDRRLLGL